MYRFFLLLAVILFSSLCLYLGLPWYAAGLAALVLALVIPVWRIGGFWFAFLGGLLVWGMYSGYLHFISEGRLSDRLAITFGVGNGWALVAVTALWGGITTGLGGYLGASLRRAFAREATKGVLTKE